MVNIDACGQKNEIYTNFTMHNVGEYHILLFN